MNISKVKEYITSLIGKDCLFKVNIGRNKYEKYTGVITTTYNNIFCVMTNNQIKSYSYNDVLIKDVVINKC